MKRALLSVSDKTGLVSFAKGLIDRGFELVSTGGTHRELAAAGIAVTSVEEVTGFPEMLDGRVKTLHPKIHAGILARRDDPAHMEALADHDIQPVDLVCVNLYPFAATIKRPDVTRAEAIEQIDIGGPSALRAAAKNSDSVWAVVDPALTKTMLICVKSWLLRSLPSQRLMMLKLCIILILSHFPSTSHRPTQSAKICAMVKIAISKLRFTLNLIRIQLALPLPNSCTVKNCPITTSKMLMLR